MDIKKENILKAHENGCDDVKKVLEDLFPEIIKDTRNWREHQRAADIIIDNLRTTLSLATNYPHEGFKRFGEYVLAQVLHKVVSFRIIDDHPEFREFYRRILSRERRA